ncbi:MAG TPA: M3 family metallopeptidase [Longimicrobiales bacterium]|nr:M3 family metallopeptidase [Longimicrobiales bacterium]
MPARVSRLLPALAAALVTPTGCTPSDADSSGRGAQDNPFFRESPLPLGLPEFDLIRNEHFAPAFERGMAEQLAEVEAIASSPEPPTFENTLVALQRSGRVLARVSAVFDNLVAAHTDDGKEALRTELAPKLSAHTDAIRLNPELFGRIRSVHERLDELELGPEDRRLVERTYQDFVRAGALLSEADKERLRAINAELAGLATRFSQNVLAEVNDVAVVVDTREELAGLSDAEIAAAAREAEERGLTGRFVLPLLNTSGQPVLARLENRELRRRIHETSLARGSRGGPWDNREIASRMVRLRAERARLLGYPSHAAWVQENQTARTPEAVGDLLAQLTPPAVRNALREAERLQEVIDAEGGGFELEAWDWAYHTEKVRRAEYDFDEGELRPYFELGSVLERGVFFAANRLYGITFEERTDLPLYHPDVRLFEVHDADGSLLALFLFDPYARPSKRGGAWMSHYVRQSNLLGDRPVVAVHTNVPKPNEGDPTLLTLDEVTTIFHEFGHALHGFFSDVAYPRFAGTSVPRDFVEFPSQVNEMWATWPEVLASYAVHYETGEPMPSELLDKVLALETFNQGFATTEYLEAAIVDQALHRLAPEEVPGAEEILAFEADALRAAGAYLEDVPPRYRVPYFSHIFSNYDAAYYSYIWSEVLDADAVEWFRENGGLRRENGDHFRATLLSRGGSADEMTLYRAFRGRDPRVEPLLERRGLTEPIAP